MANFVGNVKIPPPPEALVNGNHDVRRWLETLRNLVDPDGGISTSQVNLSGVVHDATVGVGMIPSHAGNPLHVSQTGWDAVVQNASDQSTQLANLSANLTALQAATSGTDAALQQQLTSLQQQLTSLQGSATANADTITTILARLAAANIP